MSEATMENDTILQRIKTYFQYKQRRRVSRPYTLLIFGSLFLLIPFYNYFSIAYYNDIPSWNSALVLKTLKKIEVGLLLSSFVVGLGLLSVRRWGWRFEKRHPVELDIQVNGKKLKTKDFSMSGFYADFENCP